MHGGKKVPELVQTGKIGYVFVFDRVTGKPVFPIEERPVPKGDAPGEKYSPTQPIPVKPPPVARVTITRDDIVRRDDTTPDHSKACHELWDKADFSRGPLHAVGGPQFAVGHQNDAGFPRRHRRRQLGRRGVPIPPRICFS